MELSHLLPPIIGVFGLVAAAITYSAVKKHPEGEGKVVDIGNQIHLGAMVFMKREYKMLVMFALALLVILFIFLGWQTAFCFLLGALASGTAGYIGMSTATRANVRTTTAAHNEGAAAALTVAFFGGSIMGLAVASLGLLGLGIVFIMFSSDLESIHAIHGFAMGASVVALFSRVGGGIFTKSADVGADLVGKIEAGIPEDDPRNPGVIADNVGDNVGDVAGMGSDIFESYCNSMIASIAIASTLTVDVAASGARFAGPAVFDRRYSHRQAQFEQIARKSAALRHPGFVHFVCHPGFFLDFDTGIEQRHLDRGTRRCGRRHHYRAGYRVLHRR
jgi:K(+)-stimulated pyrophosphate-energized sodium pump